jgi:iron complex outermembrane receptor protein
VPAIRPDRFSLAGDYGINWTNAAGIPSAIPSVPEPVYVEVNGSHDFTSEKRLAYESGYRLQTRDNLAFDLSAFYNHYDNLMTTAATGSVISVTTPSPYPIIPATIINGMRGKAYGGALSADWRPLSVWRLKFQYSYFQMQLQNNPGTPATNDLTLPGNSPRHQAAVYSFLDLSSALSLYSGLRFVDKLPALNVPRYVALDMSLLWRATHHLEVSLTAENIGDESHPEFSGGEEIERSVFASVTWRG